MDFAHLFEFLRGCSSFWRVVRSFLYHPEARCPIHDPRLVDSVRNNGRLFEFLHTLLGVFEFLAAWVRTVLVVRACRPSLVCSTTLQQAPFVWRHPSLASVNSNTLPGTLPWSASTSLRVTTAGLASAMRA